MLQVKVEAQWQVHLAWCCICSVGKQRPFTPWAVILASFIITKLSFKRKMSIYQKVSGQSKCQGEKSRGRLRLSFVWLVFFWFWYSCSGGEWTPKRFDFLPGFNKCCTSRHPRDCCGLSKAINFLPRNASGTSKCRWRASTHLRRRES